MAVRKFADAAGITELWSKVKSYISGVLPTKTSDLTNDSGYITGMEILSYGISTWDDFTEAYNAKKVVYCRASSNSNPASGSQTRLAFMAYVNNAATPTEVEFQYYRSINTHTESQQGDQVFVYKLTSANKWTVTTREAASKVAAGGDLTRSYSNGTVTISGTIPTVPTNVSAFTNDAGYVTTDEKVSTTAVTSGSTYYPTLGTNTTSAETKYYDNKGLSYVSTQGSSNTSGSSILTLGRAAGYGTANGRYGQIDLYSQTGKKGSIYQVGNYTADRTYALPNKSGTIALTTDIPTVPTNVSAFTNDAGYLTIETDPTVPSWAKASTKPSYTASEVGAVPTSRTVNGKALSSNINLDASDVGAQDALVSGTNIKTVNGNSLLGSGDLAISGGGAKNVWYGTCSTGSNTNQKVATTTSGDFTLTTGNIVSITFSKANGVSASLNVDSTGDVSIRMTSGSSVNALYWTAGETVTFVYNGTYYLAVGKGTATTTYYGVTKLSTSTSSTSDTVAATPSAVKAAYDLANGKQDALVSGTNIKTINNNSLLGSGDLTIPTGTTATVTQVSLTVANWNATTTCTKSVTGVTTSNSIIVSPAPESIPDYVASGVYCSAQAAGTLTFTASSTPTADLIVNVMIVG